MTTLNITASNLLGKFVSFNAIVFDQTVRHAGVVKSVCLNLDGDHEILIDSAFFNLSEITDLDVSGVLAQ